MGRCPGWCATPAAQAADVLEVIPRGLPGNWSLILRVAEKGMGKFQCFPLQQLHRDEQDIVPKPALSSEKCGSSGQLARPGRDRELQTVLHSQDYSAFIF